MQVGLADVARAAGVSVTTVSRVLSARGRVAQATKDSVMAAVQATGYSRSTLVPTPGPRIVTVAAPADPEHWQLEVCRQVTIELEHSGVFVGSALLDVGGAQLDLAMSSGTTAVVTPTFTGLGVDVPVVRFAQADANAQQSAEAALRVGEEFIAARVDLAAGMSVAFDHLSALGHRRIGLICNDRGKLAEMLVERFLAEHPVRGYNPDLPGWIARIPKSFSGGLQAAATLRDAHCTAVIVQSALQLHGVLEAMRRRSLVVPRDLSVVGFGDSLTHRFTGPPTTMLGFNPQDMARALADATRGVLGIAGAAVPSVPPTFRPRLFARDSSAAVLSP